MNSKPRWDELSQIKVREERENQGRERKKKRIKRKERDKWMVSSPFLSPIQERVGAWLGHNLIECAGLGWVTTQPML
jgi:hypothetical protein